MKLVNIGPSSYLGFLKLWAIMETPCRWWWSLVSAFKMMFSRCGKLRSAYLGSKVFNRRFTKSYRSGPPDGPTNCSITNQTADSLQVDCEVGWDGGLEQRFELALHGSSRGPLLRNITADLPQFHVDGLREGEGFDIRVRAVNARGHSEPTWLTAYAVKTAERQMSTTAGTKGKDHRKSKGELKTNFSVFFFL